VPVKLLNLQIDQGTSFTATFAWIGGQQGVNPAGTTGVALFRQLPTDTPLVQVTTTPGANGGIVYLPAIPNFPWVPYPDATPVLITIYPIQVQLTTAGVVLLDVSYCQWSCILTWPDGTAMATVTGSVEIDSV
jgi:hypothetical protein